jgi:dihydroneopterin aldolase
MAPYISKWAAKSLAGEPVAAVRIRNLQTSIYAASDAWGRERRAQPTSVSAEISFRQSFNAAAKTDQVGTDTVHYGNFSRAILRSLEAFSAAPDTAEIKHPTLRDVVDYVWLNLTGQTVDGASASRGVQDGVGKPVKPFLDLSTVRFLSITVSLPKASLLGQAISLTVSSVFGSDSQGASTIEGVSSTLCIHDIRVPTLIGVNSHERLSKQVVATTINLDNFLLYDDVYMSLEKLIVKASILITPLLSLKSRFLTWSCISDYGAVIV